VQSIFQTIGWIILLMYIMYFAYDSRNSISRQNAKYSSLESKCGAVHVLMGESNFAVIQCCNTYSSFICVSIRATESKIIEKWKYRNGKVMRKCWHEKEVLYIVKNNSNYHFKLYYIIFVYLLQSLSYSFQSLRKDLLTQSNCN